MNKLGKLLSLAILVALLLAACGPQATPTPVKTVPPTVAPATVAPTTAATQPDMCMGAQPGDEISMLYQWSGVEEESLNKILKP